MNRRPRWLELGLALCAMAIGVEDAARAEFLPIKGEIQVNAETFDEQELPAVSIAPSGDFVIVWQSAVQDGDQSGIFGRRFELAGAPLAVEFQVNVTTAGSQQTPDLDRDAEGDFVVVWESSPAGGVSDIVGRRFTADGQALGSEFQVNSYIGLQSAPKVAVRGDGAFVVAWESDDQDGSAFGVFARRYDSAGTPLATAFQVNVYTTGSQRQPTVDLEADGDFLVAWEGKGSGSGTQNEIWARRFSSTGAAQGGELRLSSHTSIGHGEPDLAIAADSTFVVVWQEYQADGPGYGIVARRFAASGTGLATEFVVNSYTGGNQLYAAIGIEGDGDFLIVWASDQPPPNTPDVFAQRFFSSGTREGSEFRVNSTQVNVQSLPAVAADPGRPAMVVAWQGYSKSDVVGVLAQRYRGTSVDIDGNGAMEPLTDGLLFLRYLFGFRGATLTASAVAGNCTRCTAEQIEAFLDSLQ